MQGDDAAPDWPLLRPEQLEGLLEQKRQFMADDAAFAGRANRRFLTLCPKANRQWPGVAWLNQPEGGRYYAQLGLGNGWQTRPMFGAPTPRFRTRSRRAANLADLCLYGSTNWLLASARCTEALARLQPDSVDVRPVEVELGDGTVLPVGDYTMVDVTCRVPAYDLAASGLEVERDEYGGRYHPAGYNRVILRDEVVAGLHLFRDAVDRIRIWVSVEVREALRKARVTSVQYAWPDRLTFFEHKG